MKLKNFTPHALTLHTPSGEVRTFDPNGPAPRLAVTHEYLGKLSGFSVVANTMGAVVGLPKYDEDTILVVSAMVAEACPNRDDLAYPGEAVRDKEGRIIGAKGLAAGPGLASRMRLQK